ncbi:phosphopyruvate hydratase [Vulcanisaeta souniana]|uniref:Enolase n=1 Tax=Vulcanisaeta souniana JCM 11219 TaxID=1293586 RepID=A0A830E1Z0_9CREN|nr:enolase C-terminal domain-like protein [Vulcanisaeta souniana]BDR92286.1 enolase [Vulcanisaeta souniana JCM 11219]GGI74419.1 enolase [Vulcanisaeta souniana JCM 11219]
MPDTTIEDLGIRKIFNSRGEETVEVETYLTDGYGRAAAPAGASRGSHEVVYFPNDNVDLAISTFEKSVAPDLMGLDASIQGEVDTRLEEIDGTENFSRIGGAVAIATSMAVARAVANALEIPLYQHLGGANTRDLPYPLGNVIGGGKHSRGLGPDIQEFLVVSYGAQDIYTAIKANIEVHRTVFKELVKADPAFTGGRNDEGAWSARISTSTALDILSKAAKEVSSKLGFEIGIGVDMAASTLWNGEKYVYTNEGISRTPKEQLEFVKGLIEKYGLVYVEDPFHEEDFRSFAELTDSVGDKCLVVGDDLFTTNPSRLSRGIKEGAANAIIVKPDQIGTLSRAWEAVRLAVSNGYTPVVSHRSGDTEYDTLAHIAVGFGAPIIKSGVLGGERITKLNELIRIQDYMGRAARMNQLLAQRFRH